jgi:hypothetical protein
MPVELPEQMDGFEAETVGTVLTVNELVLCAALKLPLQ